MFAARDAASTSGSICFWSPTRMKRASNDLAACSVPATISRGALSPPIASITMRGDSALNRDHEIGRRLTAVIRLDGHRRIRLVDDACDLLGVLQLAAAA